MPSALAYSLWIILSSSKTLVIQHLVLHSSDGLSVLCPIQQRIFYHCIGESRESCQVSIVDCLH